MRQAKDASGTEAALRELSKRIDQIEEFNAGVLAHQEAVQTVLESHRRAISGKIGHPWKRGESTEQAN